MRWLEIVLHEAITEPSLRSAIRYNGKVYSGDLGDSHLDVLTSLPRDIQRAAMGDGDNRGFATERGRYLDRRRAQRYAVMHDLFRNGSPDWVYTSQELISEWLQTWHDKGPMAAAA